MGMGTHDQGKEISPFAPVYLQVKMFHGPPIRETQVQPPIPNYAVPYASSERTHVGLELICLTLWHQDPGNLTQPSRTPKWLPHDPWPSRLPAWVMPAPREGQWLLSGFRWLPTCLNTHHKRKTWSCPGNAQFYVRECLRCLFLHIRLSPKLNGLKKETLIISHSFCGSTIWEWLGRAVLFLGTAQDLRWGYQPCKSWLGLEDLFSSWFIHMAVDRRNPPCWLLRGDFYYCPRGPLCRAAGVSLQLSSWCPPELVTRERTKRKPCAFYNQSQKLHHQSYCFLSVRTQSLSIASTQGKEIRLHLLKALIQEFMKIV